MVDSFFFLCGKHPGSLTDGPLDISHINLFLFAALSYTKSTPTCLKTINAILAYKATRWPGQKFDEEREVLNEKKKALCFPVSTPGDPALPT